MGFKVRCTLVEFMGDEESFPCHFGYKIGDEIIFDGEKFIGRVCPGIFSTMTPVVYAIHNVGNKYHQEIPWRYTGLCKKDPSMKKYNGTVFAVIKEPPAGCDEKYLRNYSAEPPREKKGGWHFVCGDSRTSALFQVVPDGLAELGWFTPHFMRQMNILEKVKKEPGMSKEDISDRFSEWEREVIYPALTPLVLDMLLDELAAVDAVEIRAGKIYPKDS
jgi:uncharacterized repeat protein (TIGR04076 family)